MALECGIVGLPNVGKSTIFSALTAAPAAAENFPFCTIDPNIGIVDLPDERLDFLPVLHGDIFQRSLVLAFLIPAHCAIRLSVISTVHGSGGPLPARQAVPPSLPGPGVPVQTGCHLPSLNETSRSLPLHLCPSPAGWIRDAG